MGASSISRTSTARCWTRTNPKRAALAKVDGTGKKLVPIIDCREGVWGIKPRNREQHFAFDALLDDRVKLVTLMGKAGTGKTLLAMAAGLKRTVLDREFRRLVVARPTISMGKELGFLPGSLEEKLAPWMQPIHDALEMLSDLNMGHEHRRSGDLMRSGSIVVEALSYIRGRSIANQFMIIDEAQNLTPLEVKTIITRVGTGTKIIFTGDPYQIDNPYVDSSSNGFNYIVSRFRAQAMAAHIELQKGRAFGAGGTGGEHPLIRGFSRFLRAVSELGMRWAFPYRASRDWVPEISGPDERGSVAGLRGLLCVRSPRNGILAAHGRVDRNQQFSVLSQSPLNRSSRGDSCISTWCVLRWRWCTWGRNGCIWGSTRTGCGWDWSPAYVCLAQCRLGWCCRPCVNPTKCSFDSELRRRSESRPLKHSGLGRLLARAYIMRCYWV